MSVNAIRRPAVRAAIERRRAIKGACLPVYHGAGNCIYDDFPEGSFIEAAGKRIDVEIGHAAPLVTDWNDDGVSDLLVGQFAAGQLRIYLNRGTNEAPRFEDYSLLRTRKELGSIPSG